MNSDRRIWVVAAALAATSTTWGCAARRPPSIAPEPAAAPAVAAPPPAAPAPAAPTPPTASPAPASGAPAAPSVVEGASKPRLRDLCRQSHEETAFVDDTRRVLAETFCGATLWFDGLFGGEPDLENARDASGRVELSTLHTEAEGTNFKGRLRVRYDLPNLHRRVNVFLGRDDQDEFIEDRGEGFAIRSSVFGLETEEKWLAGLGYRPPGRWASKVDVRVGTRIKSAPEVFVQTRFRRNVFVGTRNVWRLRETVFYENRDGFGSTSSIDFDRVLRHDLLFRWGAVGTVSEASENFEWRTASLLYYNLRNSRAVAGEVFMRGATGAEVELREYGLRSIWRQPVGRPYLFGELVAGYTWPRFEPEQRRKGSAMLGLGIEMLFGRDPY